MVAALAGTLLALAAAGPGTAQGSAARVERLTGEVAAAVETVDISGLAASPDGRWLVYRLERPSIVGGGIELAWYVVRTDGSAPPRRIGDGGTASWNGTGIVEPGVAAWSPDSSRFYLRASVEGRIGLWEGRPEGGLRVVVAGDSDVERFAVAPDGSLVYEIGPTRAAIVRTEQAERDTGVLIDGRVDLAQPLYHGAVVAGREATERFSGDWFDHEGLLAGAPRRVRVQAPDGEADRPASPAEAAVLALRAPELPREAGAALRAQYVCLARAACARPAGTRVMANVALADGRFAITLQDAAIEQQILIWDPASRSLRTLVRSRGLLNGGREEPAPCAAAPAALLCVAADAATPPRLVRIALADGTLEVLDQPNPDRRADDLVVETLAWRVGGQQASGWLIRPERPGRVPLFVTYYRCSGFLRGGLGDEWPLRALARSGIAALCINALPASRSDAEARYALGLASVRAAVALLARRGLVDPRRIGMGGLSFGSEVTMWVATHSHLLAAAAIASVQLEPGYYWFNALPGRDAFRANLKAAWGLDRPDRDRAGWRRLSPALAVGRITAPVLMQLPESEARLSAELHARLAEARMGELYAYPFAPHLKVEPRQKYAVYTRNLDWFRYWLTGQIDPDPAKQAQYRRWALLGPHHSRALAIEVSHASTSASSISRK